MLYEKKYDILRKMYLDILLVLQDLVLPFQQLSEKVIEMKIITKILMIKITRMMIGILMKQQDVR